MGRVGCGERFQGRACDQDKAPACPETQLHAAPQRSLRTCAAELQGDGHAHRPTAPSVPTAPPRPRHRGLSADRARSGQNRPVPSDDDEIRSEMTGSSLGSPQIQRSCTAHFKRTHGPGSPWEGKRKLSELNENEITTCQGL